MASPTKWILIRSERIFENFLFSWRFQEKNELINVKANVDLLLSGRGGRIFIGDSSE